MSDGLGALAGDWKPLSSRIGLPHATRSSIAPPDAPPDSVSNQSARA